MKFSLQNPFQKSAFFSLFYISLYFFNSLFLWLSFQSPNKTKKSSTQILSENEGVKDFDVWFVYFSVSFLFAIIIQSDHHFPGSKCEHFICLHFILVSIFFFVVVPLNAKRCSIMNSLKYFLSQGDEEAHIKRGKELSN